MGVTHALIAAGLLAAVMTGGDFIWSIFEVRNKMANGILHGAAVCLAIGMVIGWRARRISAGVAAGAAIGVMAALTFYALAPWLRYFAMLPAWMLFWILFAFLQQRLLRSEGMGTAMGRGVAAALLSGAAFYAISGIWTNPPTGAPRYGIHFASWMFAFFPGFVALFIGERVRSAR